MYVAYEAIDSILGSHLLAFLSEKMAFSERFPPLYLGYDTRTGKVDKIFSKELSGCQTIGSLYSSCKNSNSWEQCAKEANQKNIFYQDDLIRGPLSLFYGVALLYGEGDLGPGNVCSDYAQEAHRPTSCGAAKELPCGMDSVSDLSTWEWWI